MKGLKKGIAIFSVAIMSVSLLAGCGGSGGTSSSGGGSSTTANESSGEGIRMFEGTTIHMIAEQSSPTEAMEAQLDKFTELTGIIVDLEKAPYDDVVQKEILAFEGNTGAYDIIAAPCEHLGNLAENEYVQSLQPFMDDPKLAVFDDVDLDDLVKNLWDASGNWKDTYYGIAANSCSMFYAYRQDLFENADEQAAFKAKYGYDLAPATNWEEYKDMAEFFTRKAGDTLAGETLKSDFYGVSMSGKKHAATACEFLNYLWSFGGDIFDEDGNICVDSPEAIAALEYYVDLTQYAPPGVTSKTWDEQVTEMQQGIAAMAIMFNDGTPAIEDPSASAVVGKMGYTAVPIKESEASFYGGWGYYIPTSSQNPEAAWLFMQWFCTPDVQKGIMETGCLPNLTSLYEDASLTASIPYLEASLDSFNICVAKPRIPEWANMDSSLQLQLSNAISGTSTPEKAMKDLADDYKNNILSGKLPVTYR